MRQRSLSVLLAAATGLAMTGLVATPAQAMPAGRRSATPAPAEAAGTEPQGITAAWDGTTGPDTGGAGTGPDTGGAGTGPGIGGAGTGPGIGGAGTGPGIEGAVTGPDTGGAGHRVAVTSWAPGSRTAGGAANVLFTTASSTIARDGAPRHRGHPLRTTLWARGAVTAADVRTVNRSETTEEAAPSRRPASQYL